MIDTDVARRLREAGLPWEPHDGDLFVIDVEDLRDQPFMLSSMVIERALGRHGEQVFRFNGTTEWALDAIEQEEAIWIPRADQLREALGERFVSLARGQDGHHTVTIRLDVSARDEDGAETDGAAREVRAPRAEDALAGALLVALAGR